MIEISSGKKKDLRSYVFFIQVMLAILVTQSYLAQVHTLAKSFLLSLLTLTHFFFSYTPHKTYRSYTSSIHIRHRCLAIEDLIAAVLVYGEEARLSLLLVVRSLLWLL